MKRIIKKLASKYGTTDPFPLASELNIDMFFCDLGSVRGFYNCVLRQKAIYINSNLSEQQNRFTAAHELGHAILHPKMNTPFLRASTLIPISRYEAQANAFAFSLLLYGFEEVPSSASEIALLTGMPEDFVNRYIEKI